MKEIMKKILSTVIASLIAATMLVGCGGEKTVPTDDYTETSPDTETSDVLTDALEQYAAIVSQPDAYEFDGVEPTGNYRYALVQMSAEDAVPTLIVEQETSDLYSARLFRYDPDTGAVIQPEENLHEGTASMGGYRGTLSIMKDGNGLRSTEADGGSIYVYRITLDGDTINNSKQWEGKIGGGDVPAEFDFYDIIWHSTQDLSALDPASVQQAPEQPVVTEPEAAVPEPETDVDDGRIKLSGTLDRYGYDQVVSMQGKPDPNGAYANKSATYALVVLDEPQDLTFQTIDGADTRNVWALRVSNVDEVEQYVGQHITFSVDPYEGMFPADTSMPIGQPSAEIKVLK